MNVAVSRVAGLHLCLPSFLHIVVVLMDGIWYNIHLISRQIYYTCVVHMVSFHIHSLKKKAKVKIQFESN